MSAPLALGIEQAFVSQLADLVEDAMKTRGPVRSFCGNRICPMNWRECPNRRACRHASWPPKEIRMYDWFRAIHIIAVIAWMAGMLDLTPLAGLPAGGGRNPEFEARHG